MHCSQSFDQEIQISLFLLTRDDRDPLANQCGFTLILFEMLRFGTLLVIVASFLSGCSIDIDNLKDCKDVDGKSLPESVCRKDSDEKGD